MEGLLQLLTESISWVFNSVAGLIRMWIVDPCANDPSYRSGFIVGLVVAGVSGFLIRQLAYYYGKVQGLLAPAKEPVMKDGPSQYTKAVSTTREFSRTVTMLLLMVFLVVCLLVVVIMAVFQGQR